MAMTILNNTAAQMTLGELNKNISKVGKNLKKIAKGERLTGAGDASSDYAISEKMRVRIRALGQNERNVQTGANLLKVAEGGVQEQLEILKSIKEKVLNAANDSNTDTDRAILQKEIDQSYQQIEDIAYETKYNNKRLLCGETQHIGTELLPGIVYRPVQYNDVPIWVVDEEAKYLENSDLGIISDKYPVLDGVEGPFDVFEQMTYETQAAISALGLSSGYTNFKNGKDGTPMTLTVDLSETYSTPAELDGVGFSLGDTKYVLSYDKNKKYKDANVIDISSCADLTAVASKIRSATTYDTLYTSKAEGSKITFSTRNNSDTAAAINATKGIAGLSANATTETNPVYQTNTINVGDVGVSGTLSGGADYQPAVYGTKMGHPYPNDPDSWGPVTDYSNVISPEVPGKAASVTLNLSGASAGKAVKLDGYSDTYLMFKEGNAAPSFFKTATDGSSIYTVGLDYKGTYYSIGSSRINLDMSNGLSSVTFRAAYNGTYYNGYSIGNGSTSYTTSVDTGNTETTNYSAITPLDLTSLVKTNATDATFAAHSFDIGDKSAEDIINDPYGKYITMYKYYKNSSGTTTYQYERIFFNDSSVKGNSFRSVPSNAKYFDLNEFRKSANSTGNVATALQDWLKSNLKRDVTLNGTTINIPAYTRGTVGNNDYMYAYDTGLLRRYDVDFSQVQNIPEDLIGKGFRIYCATDESEWWNFVFTDKQDSEFEKMRQESGTGTDSIKTIRIDVSNATTPGDVASLFYDTANSLLLGKYNHNLRVASFTSTGIARLYDMRNYELDADHFSTLNGKGGGLDETKGWWKIADGIYDNIYESFGSRWADTPFTEDVPQNVAYTDLIIQDSPKANMNISLKLPKTTLDMILGYDKSEYSPSDFNVMTKEMRDKLLGKSKDENGNELFNDGILDKGIQYLTDANVLIGSQIQRLQQSKNNIVTNEETTTASDSVIRDADMAKEMTSFAKNNVLAQAAQSMLAQANQNASSVLGLLQ